jgi:hypothetical protein
MQQKICIDKVKVKVSPITSHKGKGLLLSSRASSVRLMGWANPLTSNEKWHDCDWWLGRSGVFQVGYHSIYLEEVRKTTKRIRWYPEKIQAMYLPNTKQSANHYDAQESIAKHSSLEDEVLYNILMSTGTQQNREVNVNGLDDKGSIPSRGGEFSSLLCPDQLLGPPSPLSNGIRGYFPMSEVSSVMLTTQSILY